MIRKKIIIIGAGQLGTLLSEILDKNKYKLCGYIDNDQNKIGKKFCGITVLGNDEYLSSLSPKKFQLILCLGDIKARKKFLQKNILRNFKFPKIIDKNLRIFNNVKIGDGSIVLSSANILNNTSIGKFCVVGTNANILHDVKIEDNCLIGGGTTIGANVTLKKNIFVGVGAIFASKKITVGDNSFVCSGSVVLNNVPKNSKVIGNPGKIIPNKI